MNERPILFVDVDGVISLWGFDPGAPPPGAFTTIDGIVHFLSGTAGGDLLALADDFDLVWCTGWRERANDYLPHALGLRGPLPWVKFVTPEARTAHWKLDAVNAWAGDRAVAWVDDAFDESCHVWAASRSAPTHLETTYPATGLTDDGVRALRLFARGLRTDKNANSAPNPCL